MSLERFWLDSNGEPPSMKESRLSAQDLLG